MREKEILRFATGMDLEGIMESEIKPDRGRQILYNITYLWNLKKVIGTESRIMITGGLADGENGEMLFQEYKLAVGR